MSELAWAAGLFEGEGSVSHMADGTRRLSVKMVESASLHRFRRAVGAGKVYGPYANRSAERDGYPRSPVYNWIANGAAGRQVAVLLWPLLSPWRRKRMTEIYGRRFHVEGESE